MPRGEDPERDRLIRRQKLLAEILAVVLPYSEADMEKLPWRLRVALSEAMGDFRKDYNEIYRILGRY